MDERKKFMEDWLTGGSANVAALCRLYTISRKTGYKWLERFREGGHEETRGSDWRKLKPPNETKAELSFVRATVRNAPVGRCDRRQPWAINHSPHPSGISWIARLS